MKLFECQKCRNALHFDNTICLSCGSSVGYLQNRFEMSALEAAGGSWKSLADLDSSYQFCANFHLGVCNWVVPNSSGLELCESCRHNRVIPDISFPENLSRWRKIELAKRYVFRSMMRWRLPTPTRSDDPTIGLAFDLIGDFVKPDGTAQKVQTGHSDGVITLNISEADDAEREARRQSMGEPYRTLIGHFRHEIGHYYWDMLVQRGARVESFREFFGDETQDYAAALNRHYRDGAPPDWQDNFISKYASSHPWEDFAETWAHYIHLVDALETARSYGINVDAEFRALSQNVGRDFEPYAANSLDDLVRAWIPLTVAINGVNRSMGQPDLYPFVLSPSVRKKLEFVHALIRAAA